MAAIPTHFGAGGAGLTPGSSSTADLATVLRDIGTDLETLQGDDIAALGGSVVTAISTADATDLPTAVALANATKAKVNTLITRVEAAVVKLEAVIAAQHARATATLETSLG